MKQLTPVILHKYAATGANYPLPNRAVSGVTGNYVGETLVKTRGNQGDVRIDWSPSNNDKFFGRYSFATYYDERDRNTFPLALTARNDQPFWNIGFNWNRIFGPTYQALYVVWFAGGAVVGATAWILKREKPRMGKMVETPAYYDNPFEFWAYQRDDHWEDNSADPTLKWRRPKWLIEATDLGGCGALVLLDTAAPDLK